MFTLYYYYSYYYYIIIIVIIFIFIIIIIYIYILVYQQYSFPLVISWWLLSILAPLNHQMSQDTCMASASCIVTWAVGIIRVQRYVTDFQWDIPTQLALYHGNYMEKKHEARQYWNLRKSWFSYWTIRGFCTAMLKNTQSGFSRQWKWLCQLAGDEAPLHGIFWLGKHFLKAAITKQHYISWQKQVFVSCFKPEKTTSMLVWWDNFPLNESSMNVKWTWTIFAAFAVPRKLNVAENKDILGCRSALYNTKPGWWFRKWILFFHILGIIISTDFHIFQRGSKPPTRNKWLLT